jgi:hypothetical protein
MEAAETAEGVKKDAQRHATIVLASDPTSLATARSFVSSMLDVWDVRTRRRWLPSSPARL